MTPEEFETLARELRFELETMTESDRQALANVWADRHARNLQRAAAAAAPVKTFRAIEPDDGAADENDPDRTDQARRRLRRRASAARASILDLIDTLSELAEALLEWEQISE
jgi:hypothetical protein